MLEWSIGQPPSSPQNSHYPAVVEGEECERADHREQEVGDVFVVEDVVLVEAQSGG